MADDRRPAKAAAARRAVEECIRPGLTLGLGTGSTAREALLALVARFPDERFDCVASSRATEEEARALGLPVRPLRGADRFDVMIDGADEVAPDLALVKGGGGALFREKLLAHLARELVIVVDDSKIVAALGEHRPIPVEVVPFARPTLERELALEGFRPVLRPGPDGAAFRTDNGNEILDLTPAAALSDPAATDRALRAHIGIVETGLFVGMARRVYVGHADGRVDRRGPGRPATA